ncbi:MAG: hypothetical protein WAW86_05620 [Gammaproteobacteria bacterium]
MFSRASKYLPVLSSFIYSAYRLFDLNTRKQQYQANKDKNSSKTYVFTWLSSHNAGQYAYESEYNVGHMTIQFDDQYVSLWPSAKNKSTTSYLLQLLTSDAKLCSLADDIKAEKKKPDSIMVIHGLDHANMHTALEELCQQVEDGTVKFQTINNLPLQNSNDNHRMHCATAVNKILVAGNFPVERRYIAPWSTTPALQHTFYSWIGGEEIEKEEITMLVKKLQTPTL